MDSPTKRQLSARRWLLQNPYAHIEQMEELRLARLHEYPHLDADQQRTGGVASTKARKRYQIAEIEHIAIKLQREIWSKRRELGAPDDVLPVEMLEAAYAAQVLGYRYASPPSLGWMSHGRDQIVVAGLIDNSAKSIQVATDVDQRTARFTSAHEIGHAILHSCLTGLHRDRPLTGTGDTVPRDRVEYEADKFAAFFLMPAKLVTEQFSLRFIEPFELNEEKSFALLGKPSSVARERLPTRRDVSLALAGATQYNGRNFMSLAEYFKLGVVALAIRLEELGLVDD